MLKILSFPAGAAATRQSTHLFVDPCVALNLLRYFPALFRRPFVARIANFTSPFDFNQQNWAPEREECYKLFFSPAVSLQYFNLMHKYFELIINES